MAIYELRTYTFQVGKLAQAAELYDAYGWPALERIAAGKLVGYFTGDVGAMNQLFHLWKFADDADRRAFWKQIYADEEFQTFAARLRPLILKQKNKLMLAAPWGPRP